VPLSPAPRRGRRWLFDVVAEAEATLSADGQVALVIDDEPTIRMVIAEELEEAGYRAIEASDGLAGFKSEPIDSRAKQDFARFAVTSEGSNATSCRMQDNSHR
jgi:hypothetical protein